MSTCTSTTTFDVGDLVKLTAAFTNSAGAPSDPAGLSFKVKDPNGNVTTYVYGIDSQVVRASAGNYYVEVSATLAGTWYYRFAGTGNGQAADEGSFSVEASVFT